MHLRLTVGGDDVGQLVADVNGAADEAANEVATRDIAERWTTVHKVDHEFLESNLDRPRDVHLQLHELERTKPLAELNREVISHLVRHFKYFFSTLHLRLISSESLADSVAPEEVEPRRNPPVTRPADRCEPWPLEDTARVRAFVSSCADSGVRFDVAGRLVIERGLAVASLIEASGLAEPEVVARVSHAARETTIRTPLSPALAAYLRTLRPRQQELAAATTRLVIPVRLRDLLEPQDVPEFLDATKIAEALVWEQAAATCGLTMIEWAALALLRMRAPDAD